MLLRNGMREYSFVRDEASQPPPPNPSVRAPGDRMWVFGYGSLVWRPSIPFVEREPAWIDG